MAHNPTLPQPNPSSDNREDEMIFHEVFNWSQNDNCLGQILSFLTCHDLANVAKTCKVLQKTIAIFETGDEDWPEGRLIEVNGVYMDRMDFLGPW